MDDFQNKLLQKFINKKLEKFEEIPGENKWGFPGIILGEQLRGIDADINGVIIGEIYEKKTSGGMLAEITREISQEIAGRVSS